MRMSRVRCSIARASRYCEFIPRTGRTCEPGEQVGRRHARRIRWTDLPDKSSEREAARQSPSSGIQFPHAKKTDFTRYFNDNAHFKTSGENKSFRKIRKSDYAPRVPVLMRGVRVVTNVGSAMRWTLSCQVRFNTQTSGSAADGEVVWFWRSDAGAKVAKTLPASCGRRWQPSYGHREDHV